MPALAIAAAAWSCVEKILHEAQRTLAPRSTSVSINTAVWIVMCNEPVMRTPANGFCGAYFSRMAINPGISFSAIDISFRPKSAKPMSLTLKSGFVLEWVVVVLIKLFRRLLQLGSLAGLLPGNIRIVDFAEVPVVRRLGVNWAHKFDLLDDIRRFETKCVQHRTLNCFFVDRVGAESVDVNTKRFGMTDRVSELHFAFLCQPGRIHILRDPASHVSGA